MRIHIHTHHAMLDNYAKQFHCWVGRVGWISGLYPARAVAGLWSLIVVDRPSVGTAVLCLPYPLKNVR